MSRIIILVIIVTVGSQIYRFPIVFLSISAASMNMAVVTYFEKQMEKALNENIKAMFAVPLGDMLLHARIVGQRQGLEKAMGLYRQEYAGDTDRDDI